MANEKMAKGLLIGFFSGAVVGGVLALLYAPKTGRELRGEIRRKSGEIADDVEEYLKDARVKAKQLINDGKEKSATLISDAKHKADALLKDAETILSDAKKRVSDEGTRLKGAMKAGIDAYKVDRGNAKE